MQAWEQRNRTPEDIRMSANRSLMKIWEAAGIED
jgi:hypothetical protein